MHKHRNLIIAWANGATIQIWIGGKGWHTTNHPLWYENVTYRIKPELREASSFTYPEPETKPPEAGTTYYMPCLHVHQNCLTVYWEDTKADHHYLEKGLIHLDKQAAIDHANALLNAMNGD